MPSLKEFYKEREVPDKERIALLKNIVLTVPSKEYDAKPVLEALGVSKFEVNITWPKTNISPVEEILLIQPKLVVQIGEQFTRRYPLSLIHI